MTRYMRMKLAAIAKDTTRMQVFDCLCERRPMTRRGIALQLGISDYAVTCALVNLRLARLACTTGAGSLAVWYRVPGAKRPEDGRGKKPTSRGNLVRGVSRPGIPPPATALEAAMRVQQ